MRAGSVACKTGKSVATTSELGRAVREQCFPLAAVDGCLEIAVTNDADAEALERYRVLYSAESVRSSTVSRTELYRLVQDAHGPELLEHSIYSLYRRNPEQSAYKVLSTAQVMFLVAGAALLAAFAWWAPTAAAAAAFAVVQIGYVSLISFKFLLSVHGSMSEVPDVTGRTRERVSIPTDAPLYTILVPLYRESNVIPQLVRGVERLEYPKDKLDVIMLVEEDDAETLRAARQAELPDYWAIVVVPDAKPKTKPKACNYGLLFARGEFVVIYDAEDIPEPDQLRQAVHAFRESDHRTVCFQSRLNYYNSRQNLLTRLFTLEYSYWFDYMLPGLYALKLPIPLGGTSNHFRARPLKDVGAWDPFNTTEDADLGVRLSAENYSVGVVPSTTLEEANSRPINWIRQRTRWIKGYMQTYLVYSRHPLQLLRRLGVKAFLSFQLFVGGTPLLFLLNPIMWALAIWTIVSPTVLGSIASSDAVAAVAMLSLLFGNFLAIYMNMLGAFRRGNYGLVATALLNPLYWILHSVAAYRALWQLVVKPHYWDKTVHFVDNAHE